MNPNFKVVGEAFVKLYYDTFDNNRGALAPLYKEDSMMTFEGEQVQGAANIIKKLTSLPFSSVKHLVTTFDCQPTANYGVIVFVIGQLKTDNDPPHGFGQTFHLTPQDASLTSYSVLNDLFRLSLHHG